MNASKTAVPIQKLRVRNFGCLRDTSVDFEPLTVLVGRNDAGKSMLLRAIDLVSEAARVPNAWRQVFDNRGPLVDHTYRRRGGALRVELSGTAGDGRYDYDVQVEAAGAGVNVAQEQIKVDAAAVKRTAAQIMVSRSKIGDAPLPPWVQAHQPMASQAFARSVHEYAAMPDFDARLERFVDILVRTQMHALRPEDLRRPSALQPVPSGRVGTGGLGLPHAFADLLLRDRDVANRIEESLRRAMPQVRRIDAEQVPPSQSNGAPTQPGFRLEVITPSGARIPSYLVSDGVLLFLGYLYLTLGPQPASVLMIEEPETGIHPALLRSLVKLLRDITTGAHGGPPTQVILTTHSPMLLNLVQPEEIRIVRRDDEGATTVEPFTSMPDLDKLLDYQGPGEIWVNQGEAAEQSDAPT